MLIICLMLGYLLGNVQFAVIFSRLLYHDDVRQHGSGNAGSTNMLRVFGLKSGLLTFVGDFLKGVAAVLIGRWLAGDPGGYVMALGVVLGHDFPVFLKFHGGKGVASTLGIVWCINPLFGAITTFFGVGVAAISRMVSLGSLVGAGVFLLQALFFSNDRYLALLAIVLCGLLVLRHLENIRRIFAGQESKLNLKK